MRFVPIKDVHQDIQVLHRSRQLLIKPRTALCHQIRGLLSEYGIVVANMMSSSFTTYVSLRHHASCTFRRWIAWPGTSTVRTTTPYTASTSRLSCGEPMCPHQAHRLSSGH
jgi:hypothetical protein